MKYELITGRKKFEYDRKEERLQIKYVNELEQRMKDFFEKAEKPEYQK